MMDLKEIVKAEKARKTQVATPLLPNLIFSIKKRHQCWCSREFIRIKTQNEIGFQVKRATHQCALIKTKQAMCVVETRLVVDSIWKR